MLMNHASAAGLPFSKGMVVYFPTSQKCGLKLKEMKQYLTRFAVIDSNKNGYITVKDLSAFLNVSQDVCLKAVFNKCKKVLYQKISSVLAVANFYSYGVVHLIQIRFQIRLTRIFCYYKLF